MKAITLYQPWASLCVVGKKRYETRSWDTKYRGPLLIHASKSFPDEGKDLAKQTYIAGCLQTAGIMSLKDLPLGAAVGIVQVIDCIPTTDPYLQGSLTDRERLVGDYRAGRFAWKLDDPVWFKEPIPYRGMQGLWDVPEDLLRRIKQHEQS